MSKHEKETFYFTFGTSDFFPFQLGWVEVQAEDRMEACEMYTSHYPRRDGLLNCAFVYNESEWRSSGLGEEELGHSCHQVIKEWGPFAEKNLLDVPVKHGRTEKLRVEVGYFTDSKNLLVSIYPNIKEPEYGWDCPLVDMGENLGHQPLMCAAVEVRRGDYDIPKFLETSNLAKPTGDHIAGESFHDREGMHPIYKFNLDRLLEIDPEMTRKYLGEHGFTVEQAREHLAASATERPLDDLIREAQAKATDRNGSDPDPGGSQRSHKRKEPEHEI